MSDVKMKSPKDNVVSAILKQLVSHFNQEVHQIHESPPNFDNVMSEHLEESPVTTFCLDRMVAQPSDAVFQWIAYYKTEIHALLRSSGFQSLAVLQNYEIVLSKCLDHLENGLPDKMRIDADISLSKLIVLVSDDLLFASETSPEFSNYLRCNVAIPTLLRVIYHISRAMLLVGFNAVETDAQDLVECFVSLLAFSNIRIDPTTIDPTLETKNVDDVFPSICVFPPRLHRHVGMDTCNHYFSLDGVDWRTVTLDGSKTFGDPVTGIATRAFKQACDGLSTVVRSLKRSSETSLELTGCEQTLRSLGLVRVAHSVGSQFFGEGQQSLHSKSVRQVFLGSEVIKDAKPLEDKIYKKDSSKIFILLNFVRLLRCEDVHCTSDLVAELVPCLLELLNSTSAIDAALGAGALGHMLMTLGINNKTWTSFHDRIITRLEEASKLNKEGAAIVVIGRTQILASRLSWNSARVQVSFCRLWISSLHQARFRSAMNGCHDLLIGAIVPLMGEIAKSRHADGIELGRPALAALLPLLTGEFDRRTQVAATTALINLMVAAYPIMPHHGGKIICHLLTSCTSDAIWSTENVQCVHELKLHAAALSLIICGESAYRVVNAVEAEPGKYQEPFLETVSHVRGLAISLLSNKADGRSLTFGSSGTCPTPKVSNSMDV